MTGKDINNICWRTNMEQVRGILNGIKFDLGILHFSDLLKHKNIKTYLNWEGVWNDFVEKF